MFARFGIAALVGLIFVGASAAAQIRFNFGNGDSDANQGTANVVINEGDPLSEIKTETINGVTITLEGIGPQEPEESRRVWGATSAGIGIIPNDQLGAGGQRRINGEENEYVHFSFDIGATIDTIRLGNPNNGEVVEIAFVSGIDPFLGGSPYTVELTGVNATTDVPVGVFVEAGTVLSLTATVPVQQGVLWIDMVITPIPEPSTPAMLGIAAAVFFCQRRGRGITPR